MKHPVHGVWWVLFHFPANDDLNLSLTLSLTLTNFSPLVQDLVEAPLVRAGIMPASFVDSYALNLYHDGRSVHCHYGFLVN